MYLAGHIACPVDAVGMHATHFDLTRDVHCELVEGMHGSMQLDVALASMHHALPRGGRHADAIGQAGHLLRPIPAEPTHASYCCNTMKETSLR